MMDLKKMVHVVDGHKKYGQTRVLCGLNMDVPRGTIYGLLGPSGCGKTTLLSCLAGSRRLDSGSISLGIAKRHQLGFMPQEVALFQELNIEEIFYFYGRVYGLDQYSVEYRLVQLTSILELPSKLRPVRDMSGGQQRRVSLAVTLLHNPQLIILDEPTVGLDPILAHSVWQYLLHLSNDENKTIIITTHYIEEAGQSHIVGLMRAGTLLVEASPHHLMTSHAASSLEQVFLTLCQKQETGSYPLRAKQRAGHNENVDDSRLDLNGVTQKRESRDQLLPGGTFKLNRFLAQLVRNAKWTCRNRGMLAFVLLLPLVQSLLYAVSFGCEPSGLSLAVVSDEPLASCLFHPPNITYNSLLECNLPSSLACHFITHLGTNLNIVLLESEAEAEGRVGSGSLWGVVKFNSNFSDAFIARLSEGLATEDVVIDQGLIDVTMDMSNYIISNQLRRYIRDTLVSYLRDILRICGINPDVGKLPIRMNKPVHGENSERGFSISGLPGFISSFIFTLPLTFTAGAMMMDKNSGLLARNSIAGLTRTETVLALLVVQVVVVSLQAGIMCFNLYVIFSHRVVGTVGLSVLIMASIASVGISYGFLLAELFSKDSLVNYASIGSTLSLFLTSGIIWPLEGSDVMMRSWVRLLPVVATVESLTGVNLRGYALSHPTVSLGLASALAWTIIFSFFAWILYRIKKP